MKYAFLACLALCLSGCATTAKYDAMLQSWVGKPSDNLIRSWGPPNRSANLSDGSKIVTYDFDGGSTAVANVYGDMIVASAQANRCQTNFTLNDIGVVESYSFQGNACKMK